MNMNGYDKIDENDKMKDINTRISFLKKEIKELSVNPLDNMETILLDYTNLIRRLQQKINLTEDETKKENLIVDLEIEKTKLKMYKKNTLKKMKKNPYTFKDISSELSIKASTLATDSISDTYSKRDSIEKAGKMIIDTAGFITTAVKFPIHAALSFSGKVGNLVCQVGVLPFHLVAAIKNKISYPNTKYNGVAISSFGKNLGKIVEDTFEKVDDTVIRL